MKAWKLHVLLQVVLEVIEENVAQGSRVYEQGHVSLLTSHQTAIVILLTA